LQKALTMTGPSPCGAGGQPTLIIQSMRRVSGSGNSRVVDVAHGVHVAPADGDAHLVHQALALGNLDPHRPPSSDREAVVGRDDRAVDEMALVAGQQHQQRVQVLGLPTRLRGSMLISFWPCSVCQWWWLISVSM
jgi:hypothetical protein